MRVDPKHQGGPGVAWSVVDVHVASQDLFARMRAGMPPYDVRPRAEAYTNIMAFLLRANGLSAGTEALDPTSYDMLVP